MSTCSVSPFERKLTRDRGAPLRRAGVAACAAAAAAAQAAVDGAGNASRVQLLFAVMRRMRDGSLRAQRTGAASAAVGAHDARRAAGAERVARCATGRRQHCRICSLSHWQSPDDVAAGTAGATDSGDDDDEEWHCGSAAQRWPRPAAWRAPTCARRERVCRHAAADR